MERNSSLMFAKSYLGAILFAAVFAGGAHLVFADGASTAVTVGNATPSVTAVAISPSTITLTENATTSITITATITDGNGCDSVFASGSIVATLYRSGVAATSSCTANDNNCYRNITLSEVANSCTGGVDTSGDASGTVHIWYHAEATDASSTYPSENWVAMVKATDFEVASSTASSTAELNSLYALNVTASISYGTLAANADTGASNQVATTTNTGNYKLDIEFSGTDMTGPDTIVAAQQKYSSTSVTYASLAYSLSTSATARQINLIKATASSTPSNQATYWGIAIPSGKPAGAYTGTNTFTAIYSAD
jgi:hypothetical protein